MDNLGIIIISFHSYEPLEYYFSLNLNLFSILENLLPAIQNLTEFNEGELLENLA